ncbi:MAG TPA: Spy/CpxP family protein refolding chaperone [Usitatibacter sp.]
MKRKWMAAAIGAALFSAAAWAQWGPGMGGYGMGQGMMGGYGGGDCPYAAGQGGGYGPGPGMMGGYGGRGGYGPGMMGGYGGGYGPGMMGGYGGGYQNLDLSDEQREKIDKIVDETREKQFGLMQSMHQLHRNAGAQSDADAMKNYDAVAAVRKEMFANRLEARKRIEAVLTKEQRDQLAKHQRRGRGGW